MTHSKLHLLLLALVLGCNAKEGKRDSASAKSTPTPKASNSSGDCLLLEGDELADNADPSPEPSASASPDADGKDDSKIGSSSSSHCNTTAGDPTPSESGSPSGSSGGGWDVGPGIAGCAKDGKVWVAVNNHGPSVCGDPLVTWCCSEAEIANQFPSVATALEKEFDRDATTGKPGIKKAGLKLYGCSTTGARTTFHWAHMDDTGMHYVTVYVDGKAKGGKADASCVKVTEADLGITDTKPTTGDEVVEVGADEIPAAIGLLDDTSKSGILSFLKNNEYTSWTHDAAVRSTTDHAKLKVFYNTRLTTSQDDFDTAHLKNSIAVAELYDNAGVVKQGYALMAKGKDGTTADTWLFYKIMGGPAFASDPTAYGMGVAECADCHKTATKDYIKAAHP